jgi:hypothetical protein
MVNIMEQAFTRGNQGFCLEITTWPSTLHVAEFWQIGMWAMSAAATLCSHGCEDIKHLFFICYGNLDPSWCVGNALTMNCTSLTGVVLTGVCYIWSERRQFVHGESFQPTIRAVSYVHRLLLTCNYLRARKEQKEEGWRKTPVGRLKINVDASFDIDSGTGSTRAW